MHYIIQDNKKYCAVSYNTHIYNSTVILHYKTHEYTEILFNVLYNASFYTIYSVNNVDNEWNMIFLTGISVMHDSTLYYTTQVQCQ